MSSTWSKSGRMQRVMNSGLRVWHEFRQDCRGCAVLSTTQGGQQVSEERGQYPDMLPLFTLIFQKILSGATELNRPLRLNCSLANGIGYLKGPTEPPCERLDCLDHLQWECGKQNICIAHPERIGRSFKDKARWALPSRHEACVPTFDGHAEQV